jgi:signal transduction histidine kinase/DNA-binding LacI/PurR family transcriptional regulator/AraC-like DNA-binding protein
MRPAARPTIGFLTANVHTGAARALWPGVLDAARAGDANLVCYPGGRLRAAEDFEAERNLIYQLVDTERLDGLVSWTSALAGAVSLEEVAGLHRRYDPLPIVSLASPLGHGWLVSIDGTQGMHALVFHLVDVHDYRRIALIRGPEGHPYALERYHAYVDALRKKGLSADPALVTPATSWEKGAEAMRVLLDERQLKPGVDFQAVVAVSDLLAIGALNMMAERGIRVPADVAVVGFNDIEEGRLVRPPLTSVSLPFYEQGRRSVEVLLGTLGGGDAPGHVRLDSRLLVRQSCGCPSRSVELAAAEPAVREARDLEVALARAQEQLVQQIARAASRNDVAAAWAAQLLDAVRGELNAGPRGHFPSILDGMLQQGVLDGDETAAWQGAISVLRRELLPALDARTQLRAEDVFEQARVVIGEAVQRAQIARQLQAERQNRVLRDIGQALITTFDVDKLADVLAARLPGLGIESCYLALYEDPAHPTEWSRLALAYTEGRRADPGAVGRRFPSRQLAPPDLLPARRYSLLVAPLYFQTDPIGFVAFEVGPRDGAIYEALRGHLSSALKGALLFREAHEARLVAERADRIKTRLLANVSHELRTPLNIIIGHAHRLLASPPPGVVKDLERIQHSAEHQLRIINDLLDLSRAEINALDLYPVLLDPKALIEEAFAALARDAGPPGEVAWRLDVPDALPAIEADPVRLRQILLNLLTNAAKFTPEGQITLGARLEPPHLHIWVADTGLGIPPELQERIYEPFFTGARAGRPARGIGLGLSITRHLVALHRGFLALDSQPGQGSTFHLYLPLPGPGDQSILLAQPVGSTLWLISNAETPPPEIVEFSRSQRLTIRRLSAQDDLEALLAGSLPAVIAWNMAGALSGDWHLIRRLHNHPQLNQTPFILYQPEAEGEAAAGLTSLIVKPASSQALWEAIRATLPGETAGSVLIIDDDARARRLACEAVSKGLPQHAVRTAEGGEEGLAAALADPPSLVILDLMMPDMDGFEVLDHMRADDRTRQVPVVILSGRQLSLHDVERLERHAAVTLQSKGILSEEEIIASLHRSLFGESALPPQTSALVKRALAYLHQNYARPLARWEIAQGIGVSEDYLSRVFQRELGISPWDYLNRYRVSQARELLRRTHDSVGHIGRRVGFSDPAYFSRVFRRIAGTSPRAYREHPDLR